MVVMVKGQREGSEHCRTSHQRWWRRQVSRRVHRVLPQRSLMEEPARRPQPGSPPRHRRHSQSPLTPDSLDWGRRPLALVTA